MVARSNNETRLEKMKKRNECIDNLKVLAINRLQSDYTADSPQYRETLKNLIIQVSRDFILLYESARAHFVCQTVGYDQVARRPIGAESSRQWSRPSQRFTGGVWSWVLTHHEGRDHERLCMLTLRHGGQILGPRVWWQMRRCDSVRASKTHRLFEHSWGSPRSNLWVSTAYDQIRTFPTSQRPGLNNHQAPDRLTNTREFKETGSLTK